MAVENRISVCICREEKLVLGLSKRTSCADVIQVLLKDQNLEMGLSHAPQSYCMVEKWRGFERVLPNRTKIWRLWLAWGQEQKDVKFVLVKCDASVSSHAPRSAEARVVRSEQSPCVSSGSTRCPVGVCPEKQRRIVRKAFRKLEKINKRHARKDASCAERMETLVHVVLSQDHTVRQQLQRLAELDADIEMREAKVHLERVRRHGVNYVQDTYLVSGEAACVPETFCSKKIKQFEDYVTTREALVRLHEEISEHEAQMDRLTAQIQEELHLRLMQRRQQHLTPRTSLCDPSSLTNILHESQLLLEEERIRTQLEASWYIGLRLETDLEAVQGDLDLSEDINASKMKEIGDLLQKVDTLDLTDLQNIEGEGKTCVDHLDCQTEWMEQVRGLSKAHDVNDDDSDTGLSSLHSQDSEPAQWAVM
ncbi:ras association domain-containing protein 10 [Eucyclogobius newberryi]|uniref:ras association domain-containing protein 10 n=1 Tax=Eucyclogobius newberryi TaxID=166745 RepID=UPI003B5ADE5B